MLTIDTIKHIYNNAKPLKPFQMNTTREKTKTDNLESVTDDMKRLKQITRPNFIRQSKLGRSTIDKNIKILEKAGIITVLKNKNFKSKGDLLIYLQPIKSKKNDE